MKLIIAEKPSLGRNIANAIGIIKKNEGYIECKNDYIVTYAFGHILTLEDVSNMFEYKGKKWYEYDLPIIPKEFKYVLKKDKGVSTQIKTIKTLLSKADCVINAGDADREGQIIIDNILKYLNNTKKTYRLWLPEQTEQTIRKALNNLEDNSKYYNLNQEGLARTYMDWLLGINSTIILTNKSHKLLKSGRVIVPIVKYIYDRDMEIENFKPTPYFSVENDEPIKLILNTKFDTKQEATTKCNELNKCNAIIENIESKNVTKQPKKLFSLSTLQSELSKKFKISFTKSLETIQGLYEKGLLTYPRTNTEYLATNEKDKVKDILKTLNDNGLEFRDSKKIFDDSKIESHSAIIITTKKPSSLTEMEDKVYSTVKNRFLSNFCKEDCIIKESTMIIKVGNEEFKIKGQSVINQGWLKYETNVFENELPNLKIGDKFKVDFKPIEKQTTPPAKISESTLSQYLKNPFKKESDTEDDEYKAMLEGVEIGTEATRTPTIQKCIDIGYIESKKNIFSITDLGKFFIEQLDANKIDLYKNKTVEFSKLQKEIYKGHKKISDILELVKKELNNMIENSNKTENTKYVNNVKPGDVLEIKSAKGTFYKGIFKGDDKEGILPEEMRYFDNRPKINKNIAKKLFEGKDVEFELDYKGKSYKAKLHLVRKGQFLNLEK